MSRQRLDWADFFHRVPQAHGVRLRLAGVYSTAPESLTAEKRLVRIVRALAAGEPFALRRSFASGPAIIDCVFRTAADADDLAREIGAVSIQPPRGWATARELVADDRALRRLLKLGAEGPRARATKVLKVDGPPPSIPPIIPATMPDVAAASSNPVGEARSRLARMPPEEQAAALFRAMMEDSRES